MTHVEIVQQLAALFADHLPKSHWCFGTAYWHHVHGHSPDANELKMHVWCSDMAPSRIEMADQGALISAVREALVRPDSVATTEALGEVPAVTAGEAMSC